MECQPISRDSKINVVIDDDTADMAVKITTKSGKVYVRGDQYDHLTYCGRSDGGCGVSTGNE